MKAICYLLGVVLVVVAIVYFLMPADQLPSFMPGHAAGVDRVHLKHGGLAAALAIAFFALGWIIGRRRYA